MSRNVDREGKVREETCFGPKRHESRDPQKCIDRENTGYCEVNNINGMVGVLGSTLLSCYVRVHTDNRSVDEGRSL